MPLLSFGQRETVKGRVYSGRLGIKDVLVVNLSAQAETRTDSVGNFSMKVQVGDLLAVSDYKVEERKIRFTPDLIQNGSLLLEVKMAATELEEVVINKYDFSAYKMGLTKTDIVLPTVAERRMNSSAGDPVGLLISVLSGQHKILKNNVKTEERIIALETLDNIFEDADYIDDLKIPADKINGFKYYAVEDDAFRALVKTTDKGTLKFELAKLATKYLTISNEK